MVALQTPPAYRCVVFEGLWVFTSPNVSYIPSSRQVRLEAVSYYNLRVTGTIYTCLIQHNRATVTVPVSISAVFPSPIPSLRPTIRLGLTHWHNDWRELANGGLQTKCTYRCGFLGK